MLGLGDEDPLLAASAPVPTFGTLALPSCLLETAFAGDVFGWLLVGDCGLDEVEEFLDIGRGEGSGELAPLSNTSRAFAETVAEREG